ncbi:helical backbone metal receptor [Echinicola jeungdonensis]|uniref:ABC transporter substrate-binding protein n=1 Tax=Echinicola jeungdonensis TaxID=709343 RepID=A0ABV5J121_9BACT|nr:helical backbone metal receptor [Echinicola jeungdonensis]MDN3668291.1 helical backbone metal receptor [Echinicola jeungdonensis]
MKYLDQMNRKVWIGRKPERIVSLVPSLTELLVDLGLGDKLVGVTKFCNHPKGLKKEKVIVGGTKNFHFDKIKSLQPDLIIGNKEENYKEGIERLEKDFPVWVSDVEDLGDVLVLIWAIGEITDTKEKAKSLNQLMLRDMEGGFLKKGTSIYLIWKNPMIAVGRYTFIDTMMVRAGFINIVSQERYPEITEEEIRALEPEYILLSTEPYPFNEKDKAQFKKKFPFSQIKLVDGELFSWYGSRLLYSSEYFKKL